jgi:DNA-binding NtrC family response regulator
MEDYSLRILLVDDDEDDYIITEDLLSEIEGRKFELDWYDNYDDALAEMKRNQHDICLIDYRLGRENGLRLLREAIDLGCRAPIILMTGQGDRDVDLEAMQAGAADYLVKGQVDAMSLERTLRYTYEHHRLLEKTQRQLHELTILHAVTNAAAETNNEDVLIDRVTKIIGEAFQADSFGFLLLNNLNHVLSPHSSYHANRYTACLNNQKRGFGNILIGLQYSKLNESCHSYLGLFHIL